MSEESKEKNRQKHIGKNLLDTTKKKISKKLMGVKKSPESAKRSSISRRSFSLAEMEDILTMKKMGRDINETINKYPHISKRALYYIRAGRYLK